MTKNIKPTDISHYLTRHHTVPILVITWILHNDCMSNVHLASLANVCKKWRDVCCTVVTVEAISLARQEVKPPLVESESSIPLAKDSELCGRQYLHSLTCSSNSTLRTLFLTDMARELIVRHENLTQSSNTNGNFCLAWFAPSGIQITTVSLEDEEDMDRNAHNSPEFRFDFTSIGGERSEQKRNSISVPSVSCCREWRGYRHATEVLAPFGYATSFVRDVLDASLTISFNNDKLKTSCDTTAQTKPQTRLSKVSSLSYNPTFSVRGATLARSEGYCLCLDNEYISTAQHPRIDGWMNHSFQELNNEPIKTQNDLTLNLTIKQSILARALLPRVVMSTRSKAPIMHRFHAQDSDGDKGQRDESVHDPHQIDGVSSRNNFTWERRQRAVQFLNCDRSQAVRLITPSFCCGGVQGPITMFIIAITTEDGCFVSGRKSRFEFGHMYPINNRDMITDQSPICIASGNVDEETSYSSDDSDQYSHCHCNFASSDPFNPKDITINDPSEDRIHRGTTGPGLWHCYVAVFDGLSSFIRVDGEEEPQQKVQSNDSEIGIDDPDSPSNSGRYVGSGTLDGLTLGSDHLFDMSLCYGEIDGECGQGAISELAVFKGRMDLSDITMLESYLMKKHGIPSVKWRSEFISSQNRSRLQRIRIGNQWEEDEWKRQANALISQRPPWDLVGDPVPLRVAANHHTVAWQRADCITGTPLRVSRIGHKLGNGSSDW